MILSHYGDYNDCVGWETSCHLIPFLHSNEENNKKIIEFILTRKIKTSNAPHHKFGI